MTNPEGFHRWLLETWCRDQIPVWRSILVEAEAVGQQKRTEYARWILQEILEKELGAKR